MCAELYSEAEELSMVTTALHMPTRGSGGVYPVSGGGPLGGGSCLPIPGSTHPFCSAGDFSAPFLGTAEASGF